MTELSSQVLRRASLSLGRNLYPLLRASRLTVHTLGVRHSAEPRAMLGRAIEAGRAAAAMQQSRKPTGGKPSSFPSNGQSTGSQTKTQSNISTMFNKPHLANSSKATPAAPAKTALQHRSPNIINSNPPRFFPKGQGLASLYKQSDSFKEEEAPEATEATKGGAAQPSAPSVSELAAAVQFSIEDLSDDESLALEFQAPSALPSRPQQEPGSSKIEQNEPPPASNTSVISWSQSSPSHYRPPPRPSELMAEQLQPAAKRPSPDNEAQESVPIKKKRQLPPNWDRQPADQDLKEVQSTLPTSTPVKTNPPLWNTTESAVKAQKKQLKTQQQQKESIKFEATLGDMHQAMKSHVSKSAPIVLSDEQKYIKSLVVEQGQSVFFTGPAGTGKSVLMRAIIQDLKKKYIRDPERVAITASTGLAACNIGGMTLHSFAGIGLGKEDVNTLVKKIRRNPKAKNRWLKTKVLIIDEISMVDAELFDKLSQIGRIIRNNGRPWGGIQLVITGDFFQLPPVPESGKTREAKFAFEAATWNMSIDHTIALTEVFRQKDPEFAEMLNEMRLGKISDKTVRNFQALSRPLHFDDGLEVTELFPTRQEVDSSNQKRLQALAGKTYRYDSVDTGSDPVLRDKLLANMMAPPTIELKKGAQVMLIKNMDDTLVNGSLGTVIDFMTESTFEIRGGADDSDVESDAKRRIRSFANALSNKEANKEYPLVRFHAVDGTQRNILCVPEDWKVELPTGEVQAARKQLPLILAWALSIHKAQGQTLERVKVDLGKVFEKGQAYVALSRATSQKGLQVLNFQKSKVMAHPRVIQFYNKLSTAESVMKKKAAGSITSYTIRRPGDPRALPPTRPQDERYDDEQNEEARIAYG